MSRATVASLSRDLADGRITSRRLVEQALARIHDTNGEGSRAFVKVYAESALSQADASDALRSAGVVRSVVEGIPISVKDLFDVAGDVTRAGSTVLRDASPASADALAVARLRAAGAIILGRTVTVEFAMGAVGANPHYGTPKNPFDRASGGRIPGGSSSGAAVAVSDGMGTMGLGSDTRGSVRIPAALCGVTGFKPTASRIPTTGVFPLSATLDSIGPLGNSVACCAVYDAIMAGEEASAVAAPDPLPMQDLRFLIPRCSLLDSLDAPVSKAFDLSVEALRAAGANVKRVDMPILTEVQEWYRNGGVIAPEAHQVHQSTFEKHRDKYDPRVASRIEMGASISASDYIQLQIDRKKIISKVCELVYPYHAMLYPTTALVAPTIEEATMCDEEYSKLHLKLVRNTGLANLLDGCAVTIPCQRSDESPVGLTVAGMGGTDKHILAVARAVEEVLLSLTAAKGEDEPPLKRVRA